MPLVCIGYDVDFELEDGRKVAARENAAMLYDKTGEAWPFTSIVLVPFRRGDKEAKHTSFSRAWFGRGYDLREGVTRLPPRELDEGWKSIGRVLRVFYTRGSGDDRSAKREGDYEHDFARRGLFDVFTFRRPKLPELSRYGEAMRLEIWRDYAVSAAGID